MPLVVILVKEGRVAITSLFHSICLISQCCFNQNIMIPYTFKIYDFFFELRFLSRKNLALNTFSAILTIHIYFGRRNRY